MVPSNGRTPHFRAAFDASCHLLHGGLTCVAAPHMMELQRYFFSPSFFSLFNLKKYTILAKNQLSECVICKVYHIWFLFF